MAAGGDGVSGTGVLHAVRHPGPVAASDALAWFAEHRAVPADDQDVFGYLLAPSRAEWFRCAGGVAHGPDGPRDLGDAYELSATAGIRRLRWFHQAGGYGQAVCLSEDTAAMPPGELAGAADSPERRRLENTAERILAGRVIRTRDRWATLATARYPSCDVPVTASVGQEVWAFLAEYAVRDRHGNVSVTDTLLLSLAGRDAAPAGKERQE
jgi:hypothetical protein